MSSKYLTRYGQGSVFNIRFQGSVEIMDPCLYFFEYSPNVLKKKIKVLDILNTDKKSLRKTNIESSPPVIWIRKTGRLAHSYNPSGWEVS